MSFDKEIITLRKLGLSFSQIAARLDLTKDQVQKRYMKIDRMNQVGYNHGILPDEGLPKEVDDTNSKKYITSLVSTPHHIKPVEPSKPVAPAKPVAPVAPIAPVAPLTPI